MKVIFSISFIFVVFMNSAAQKQNVVRNPYIKAGLKQIKESANFGLVFSGPNVNYGHYWAYLKSNRKLIIENELGVSIPFSKGIPSLNVYLKPAEFSWLYVRNSSGNELTAGPLVKFEYDYTLYPQLQSAFDYWFTNLSLGVNSSYKFFLVNQALRASLKISLCGFTSRQANYRNPYFYDIGFIHAIRHLHSNFEFSTLGEYNTTRFEFTWILKPNTRFNWTYSFDYSGFFEEPAISIINHQIKLTVKMKNNKS